MVATLGNLNTELPHDPATPYPREMKTQAHIKTIHGTTSFIIVPNWKQTKCPPTEEWVNEWDEGLMHIPHR